MRLTLFLFCLALSLPAAAGDGLTGRVMCGYQGWFRAEGDGSDSGWRHYANGGKFEPGHAHIEIWPDVSELGPEERFATPFKHADGRRAEVFSSVVPATVRRHFEWMRDYGIDGVFLQRFATETRDQRFRESMDKVLGNVRTSANATGRKWVLMYDLSGLVEGGTSILIEDFERLRDDRLIALDGSDNAYLFHRGKPLVALWGLGFNDRPPMLDEWDHLVKFFRDEAGCSVMLGVPCYWRTLDRDAIRDPRLHAIIAMADVVSPWSVGRFGTPEEALARGKALLEPDMKWCEGRGLDYLPVIFPGFSWQNLQKGRGVEAEFDQIPRRGGKFLWSQAVAAKRAGAESLYVAMFDELDEATAIFKTTQDPPVGASPFLKEPELPNDHYLWLAGRIGRMVRSELPVDGAPPQR